MNGRRNIFTLGLSPPRKLRLWLLLSDSAAETSFFSCFVSLAKNTKLYMVWQKNFRNIRWAFGGGGASPRTSQHGLCPWTPLACISTPNMVGHDICRHNYAVERRQVVGFCGQPHYCYQPYYPAARFRSSISLVKHGL